MNSRRHLILLQASCHMSPILLPHLFVVSDSDCSPGLGDMIGKGNNPRWEPNANRENSLGHNIRVDLIVDQ